MVPALENTSKTNGYVTAKKIVQQDAMNGTVKEKIFSRKCLWSFRPQDALQTLYFVGAMINAALATANGTFCQLEVIVHNVQLDFITKNRKFYMYGITQAAQNISD